MKTALQFVICLLFAGLSYAGRPFTVEDMHQMLRASDAQLSPDGKWIAFSVARSDVAKNKMVTNLWIVSASGGDGRPLTFGDKGANMRPRWSPDSKWLYFLSTRTDRPQLYRLPLQGGEAVQLTKTGIGVDSFVLSPDGKTVALTASVFPDCQDLSCSDKKAKEKEENPVKARVLTTMPVRRWDTWVDGKRNHIFVMSTDGGEPRDLTPGDVDSPIWSEGGGEEVAFSPDSREIAFSRYTGNEAFSGNSDLFTIPVTGGEPARITTNPAADTSPLYSPDGQYIAYTGTIRPDLETDHQRLFLYNRKTGNRTELSEKLDRSVMSFAWSPDSKTLWITTEDNGQAPILKMDIATATATKIYDDGTSGDLQVSKNGSSLYFSNTTISRPAELFRLDLAKPAQPAALTGLNAEILKDIEMGEYSSFTFTGSGNEQVQCWQVKPPAFDPKKKYPLLLLMHGGPESAWLNQFHYRWNAQLFAAPGYVVVAPNFHGSVGWGLKFMDAIKGNWGTAPYEDQMKAVDEALKWPYVDSTRLAAAGASYGGYMANWVAGHTDRFRTIVNHDGIYDLMNGLYAADLPGGIDKEFKGTAWLNPQALIDPAPVTYAKNFKTPMLVIHGEKDYRVELSQGLATYQLLQARNIPSKLLVFPDENHWVLKPANSILWYHTVLDWIAQWVK